MMNSLVDGIVKTRLQLATKRWSKLDSDGENSNDIVRCGRDIVAGRRIQIGCTLVRKKLSLGKGLPTLVGIENSIL